MENKAFDEEIDLVWLIYALLRKWWLIVAVAVVCACGAAAYTNFTVAPTYTSSATVLMLSKETTITSMADLSFGSQLTKDYTVLITSRPVLERVIENLGLNMHYKALKGSIVMQNPEDTRILIISATMNDPELAKAVVDELAVVSSEYIADVMEVIPPKIIEEGEVSGAKTGPNVSRSALMGFLAGAVLVCAIIIVLELLNDSIQTEEDVERYLGIPTLAAVPDKSSTGKKEKNSNKGGKAKKWHIKA